MPAISKIPQKKRTPTRRSEPKLFRCTGFGHCDMVFTRSEHLARHARKHTGEKPFKCVFPTCNRMFSRFDNMMQHTHTHTRTKKKDSSPISVPEDINSLTPMDNQTYYHPPSPTSQQEDDYCIKYQNYYNESSYNYNSPPQFHQSPVSSFSHHTTFSPPRSPAGSVPPTADYYSELQRKQKQCYTETIPKRRLSCIELAAPIQQLVVATDSETDDDERQMSPLSSVEDIKIEGIDITADEYEALQGFSKFYTEPVVRKPMLTCTESLPIQLPPLRYAQAVLSSNPSLTSQVYAFRQQIPTFQESFKRTCT